MTDVIALIAAAGIPTDSYVQAGLHMNRNLPTPERGVELITELTGEAPATDTDGRVVQFTAAYLVQALVRRHVEGAVVDAVEALTEARQSALDLIEKQGWLFAGVEDEKADIENVEPEVVKAGKAKKGARKVLALRVYNEQIAGKVEAKEMTRKEAIAILMTEVGLSAAGASTYYANFKSGKWA